MTLGDVLKQYREENNISMDEFSKISSLSKGYISMLENNINPRNNRPIAPTLPTIQKIAAGMHTDVDSLLRQIDNNQPVILDVKDATCLDDEPLNKKFLEKLDFMMKEYGLNKHSLSQKSEIPYTTIDAWYKKGYEGLKLTTLRKLADYFNTTLDFWILDEITDPNYEKTSGFKVEYEEMEHIKKYRALDSFGKETISLILDREVERVKFITKEISEKEQRIADIKSKSANIVEFRPSTDNGSDERMTNYYHSASAGSGIFIMGNESTEQIAIPNTPENANVDYAIKVSGDSMEPGFSDGDIVLVSQKAELYCGDIGIFIINGKAYIKEYAEIELISTNPNVDNIKISEFDNIVCMGKVVGKLDHLQNHLSHEDEVAIREANNLLNKKKLKKKES